MINQTLTSLVLATQLYHSPFLTAQFLTIKSCKFMQFSSRFYYSNQYSKINFLSTRFEKMLNTVIQISSESCHNRFIIHSLSFDSNLDVENCYFFRCSNRNGNGGAINAQNTSIKIKSCLFQYTYAKTGGAICIQGSDLTNIIGSLFDFTKARESSGAIFTDIVKSLKIELTNFSSDVCDESVSVLTIDSVKECELLENLFIKNKCKKEGVMKLYSSLVRINLCRFYLNEIQDFTLEKNNSMIITNTEFYEEFTPFYVKDNTDAINISRSRFLNEQNLKMHENDNIQILLSYDLKTETSLETYLRSLVQNEMNYSRHMEEGHASVHFLTIAAYIFFFVILFFSLKTYIFNVKKVPVNRDDIELMSDSLNESRNLTPDDIDTKKLRNEGDEMFKPIHLIPK